MRRKASIYSIASNHSRAVESELSMLVEESQSGSLVGLSYAATSNKRRNIIGVAGSHVDSDRAIASLFRAAVSLSMAG